MKLNNRGNWTLIGLLVAVAIVIVVAAMYFAGDTFTTVAKNSPLLDKASTKKTVMGRSIDTAKAADCQEHLRQIRTGIAAYKTTGTDDRNPPTFKDMNMGVSSDYFQCPVTNQPYKYDPNTGVVGCPSHPNF